MKPQSKGYFMPRGSGLETLNASRRGSYLSFTLDPRGDSTTTWKTPGSGDAGSLSSLGMAHTRPLGRARAEPARAVRVADAPVSVGVLGNRDGRDLPDLVRVLADR